MGIAFQAAHAAGNNFADSFQRNKESDAMDRILSNAMNSKDPAVLQQSIGKLLSQVSPKNQAAAVQLIQGKIKGLKEESDREKLRQFYQANGMPEGAEYAHPTLQAKMYEQNAKNARVKNILGEPQGAPGIPAQGPSVQDGLIPESPQNNSGNRFAKFNKDQLTELTGAPDREIAEPAKQQLNNLREDEKRTDKKFEADRKYHSKTSDPIVTEANDILKKYPVRKGLINQQRLDISSGNTTGLKPFLVEKTGLEFWRTPEEARFKTAAKQRFIENLSSIGGGARPNMFIEQQLVGAQAALGRDEEANQTVLDMEEFIDDLEAKRAQYIREIANEDQKTKGYVRNDVAARADEKMGSYAKQRQEQMAYDIRSRKEQKMSDYDLTKDIISQKVVPGTPLTKRAARILMIKNGDNEQKASDQARKLGYTIPGPEIYNRDIK